MTKVLVVGADARTSAIVWKLKKDNPKLDIFCSPGNAGIEMVAKCEDIALSDINGLLKLALKIKPDLTLVGPEGPYVDGIVDLFQEKKLKIFGPTKAAAQIESSKIWADSLLTAFNVPHAKGIPIFEGQITQAIDIVKKLGPKNIVIKADGLAAGKGVILPNTLDEAIRVIKDMISGKLFGDSGKRILIQERLPGQELSVMAIVGPNKSYCLLPVAKDNKRIHDPLFKGSNPNTGGMGGYAPAEYVSKSVLEQIKKKIIEPTLRGMEEWGVPFRGILYGGLMLTKKGPMVYEFNCRSGDPETEVQLPLIEDNLYEVLLRATSKNGKLKPLSFRKGYTAGVVLAAANYPDSPKKGDQIFGLESVSDQEVFVFHAGTKKVNGQIITNGGRILEVVAYDSKNRDRAFAKAYANIGKIGIHFNGMQYRKVLTGPA